MISFLVRIFVLYIAGCFDPTEQACDGPGQRRDRLDRGAELLVKVLDRGERPVVEWKVDGFPGLR